MPVPVEIRHLRRFRYRKFNTIIIASKFCFCKCAGFRASPLSCLQPVFALPRPISDRQHAFCISIIDRSSLFMDLSRRLYTCRFCESIAVFRDGSASNGTTHDGLVSDADGKSTECGALRHSILSEYINVLRNKRYILQIH